MNFNLKEFKRFEKQIILKKVGIQGQKKIKKTKILIIGIGGLGCPLLTYLAASGIGHIGIVDPDKVELGNLNRQILFNSNDLNKYKVIQAKAQVKKIYKNIKIKPYKSKLTPKNIKSILKGYDIVCDGTDNYETRYLINDYCLKYKKILISAAISKFDGQIFKFNFKKKDPCFRCFMPETPDLINDCETEGVSSTLAGIAGTLQANEVIKSILNINNNQNRNMLIFNSLSTNFRKIKILKNPNCIKECLKR